MCSFLVLSSFLWKGEISANFRSVGNSQFNIALSYVFRITGEIISEQSLIILAGISSSLLAFLYLYF